MHQGDPISAFLIILAQEVSFVLIEWNNHIKGLDVYGHNFLYTAHIDDSSFFFNNKKSVIEIFKILDVFSFLPGLKSNKEQCEVAGIGVKKVIKVALYRMKNINLKQTQGKLSEFIIFTTKKIERISKSYTKNRECSENIKDEKFNPWRENHNHNIVNFSNYVPCTNNSFI